VSKAGAPLGLLIAARLVLRGAQLRRTRGHAFATARANEWPPAFAGFRGGRVSGHTHVGVLAVPPRGPPRFAHGGATGGVGKGHGVDSHGSAVARRGSAWFRCSAKDHGQCRLALRERSCMPQDALGARRKLAALSGERSSVSADRGSLGLREALVIASRCARRRKQSWKRGDSSREVGRWVRVTGARFAFPRCARGLATRFPSVATAGTPQGPLQAQEGPTRRDRWEGPQGACGSAAGETAGEPQGGLQGATGGPARVSTARCPNRTVADVG
jgi:hypothetical protein